LDPGAAVEDRVNDLLPRLTETEKLNYIGGYNSMYIRAVSRLGIPAIKMSDGPVGVRTWGKSTAYPAGILSAATWDTALVGELGHALGKDCRSRGVHILLAPGVNIYRAPMCGRNFEYFGEDPYLASRMAVSYIKGVQQEGVTATVKHYAANNQEWDRYNVSSDLDERTLQEIYLPAFKAAVTEAATGCVMCSYNLVNGVWASQNYHLLTDILKNDWEFSGLVMSDWGATHNAPLAARAGLDLEMPSGAYMNPASLAPLIANGSMQPSVIDDKVRRILRVLLRFGFFDRPQADPAVPSDYAPNAEVALNLAREGIVLLKNQDNILPLNINETDTLAVFGENAGRWVTGGGSSWTEPFHYVSILQGIQTLAGSMVTVLHDPAIDDDASVFEHSLFYTDETGLTKGLTANYYNNQTLTGDPFHTRIDTIINNSWGAAGPVISGFPVNNFSIRWTGTILADSTGDYELVIRTDDGARVYLGNTLLIDKWNDQAATTYRAVYHMTRGETYAVVLEYYENGGDAEIRFGYRFIDFNHSQAVALAEKSDAAVVCVGFNSDTEGEGFDRTFNLPLYQDSLINAIARVNPNTIVVLNAGGNVATGSWLGNVKALLHAWYTGQEGGTAIAEILFGITNPSGKLPVSLEKRWEDNPVNNSYYDYDGNKHVSYSEGLMLGYRYYQSEDVEPLFPFGYGLSYTTFSYSDLEVTPDTTDDPNAITVSFNVSNAGTVDGAEIAQLYVRQLNAPVERPARELKGFARLNIQAGETKRANLFMDSASFSYFKTGKDAFGYDTGTFEILVGSSSADIHLSGTVTLLVTDTTGLQIQTFAPAGETTGTGGLVEFSLSFSEKAFMDPSKRIRIYKYATGDLHETINNQRIAGLGTGRIRFTNNNPLVTGEQYFILIDSAAFTDYHDNPGPGIMDKSVWNFTLIPSGTEQETSIPGSLLLYPNPAGDHIFIELPWSMTGEAVIDIFDLTGRKVVSFTTDTYRNTLEYPCSSLRDGLYIIRCTSKSSLKNETARFIKSGFTRINR
jgi:beta-glucosidase